MSESIAKEESTNPLRIVRIEKVTLNIATGKSGEPLEKAKKVLTQLTNKTPTTKQAKKAIKDFGVRKGEPIAAVVTLRGKDAGEFLELGMFPKWESSAQPFTLHWGGLDIESDHEPSVLQKSDASTTFRRKTPSSSCRTASVRI